MSVSSASAAAIGVSPQFSVSAEDLTLHYRTGVTWIDIDGVHPPILGENGGYTAAMNLVNLWYPWADEKLVEPKFDGVCHYTAAISNRPTFIKDFHMIGMMRIVDKILAPSYQGLIVASVGTVVPSPPPQP